MSSGSQPISIKKDSRETWIPNPRDLSTTPGGTLYATTPGGTKIVYPRDTLLMLSKSPLSKGSSDLPLIPGVNAPENFSDKKRKRSLLKQRSSIQIIQNNSTLKIKKIIL